MIFCNMSDNGAGRYMSHSSNYLPLFIFPLKSLWWKNRSNAATEQGTLILLTVSRALGMNSSSSFLFLLLLLIVLSFLSLAFLALVREAQILNGHWKA
jgi:hypothetical protein